MMSVRSSAESPSIIWATRAGSSFSKIAPRRVIVGWSSNSMTRATGNIMMTAAASISFNWLSSSTRSSGRRSTTCSLMPMKLSSRRRLIRSRNSSSVVTHSPPLLPFLFQVIQKINESEVAAQVIQTRVVGEERVVFVAELNRCFDPCGRFVAHVFHGIERGEPQRHVVIGGGDLFDVVSDYGSGAVMFPARAVTPAQNDLQRVEVRMLPEHVLGQ